MFNIVTLCRKIKPTIMKNLFLTLMSAMLLVVISCGGDDPAPNNAPDDFTVTVGTVGATTADVSWTAASDPDGDDVTYSFLFTSGFSGSESITSNSATSVTLTSLTPETTYAGDVIADDGNGGETSSPFSFITQAEVARN